MTLPNLFKLNPFFPSTLQDPSTLDDYGLRASGIDTANRETSQRVTGTPVAFTCIYEADAIIKRHLTSGGRTIERIEWEIGAATDV